MNVRDFQKRYQLSNKEFAGICGCSVPTVQKWRAEGGCVSPAADRLMRLLDYAACGSREQLAGIFSEVGILDEVIRVDKQGSVERLNNKSSQLAAPENFLLAQRQIDSLKSERARLEDLLESIGGLAGSSYILSESDFRIKWASKQFSDQFLGGAAEPGDLSWMELFADGEDAGNHWKAVRSELLTTGKSVIQAPVRKFPGRVFHWTFVRLQGETEAKIKYLLQLKDVTEERSVLHRLNAAVRTLEQVLELDARPILIVSRSGGLLGASKSGHRLLEEFDFDDSHSMFKHVFAEHSAAQLRRLENLREGEILEFRRLIDGKDMKTLIRTQEWWGEKSFTLIFEQQVLSPLHVGKMTLRRLRTEQFVSSIFEVSSDSNEQRQSGHNQRINQVLASVGDRLGVSRAYLFQIDYEGNCVSNTHEWCAEGVRPEIDALQNVPIDGMPYWWSCMRRGEPIVLQRIADFPPEAETERLFLEAQDVSAIAIYPITVNDRLTGFVGFDCTGGDRCWTDEDLLCLKMVRLVVEMAIESAGFQFESEVYRSEIKEILQGAELGFWRWNFRTGELFVDDRYLSMLGLNAPESSVNFEFLEKSIHPDDRGGFLDQLNSHLQGQCDEAQSVFRIKHQSGGWLWVLGRAKVIERSIEDAPEIVVGTFLDVTDSKRREVELVETKRKLERSISDTSSVIGRICSELRTPLNAIGGISEIFQQGGEDVANGLIMDQLDQSVGSMSRTIQSLEYYTKVETGGIMPAFESISPGSLVESIKRRFSPVFEDRNLPFSVNLESSLRGDIRLDERIYNYIIDQLVDNACRFAHEGAVRLQLYSVRDEEGQNWFVTELTDSGIGFNTDMVEEADQSRIGEQSPHRRSGGLGLGLSICKKLAKILEGKLLINSKPGRGTKVLLSLPYNVTPETELLGEDRRPTLLLAEDHPVSQSIGKRILEMLGYDVTVVENGKSALEWMQRNISDVILLDMQMPIMSGWEFLEEFRGRIRTAEMISTPVIITSALDLDIDEMIEEPVVAVIQKPYSIKSLKQALDEVFVGNGSF